MFSFSIFSNFQEKLGRSGWEVEGIRGGDGGAGGGEQREGSHDVDIIIGGELLNDDAWLKMGEGVSKICEKVIMYYIICGRSHL